MATAHLLVAGLALVTLLSLVPAASADLVTCTGHPLFPRFCPAMSPAVNCPWNTAPSQWASDCTDVSSETGYVTCYLVWGPLSWQAQCF